MKLNKVIARHIVFPALMAFKVEKIVRNANPHSILNVMYHGVVSKDGTSFSPRHITKEQFERHLAYYKKSFDVISIPEAFHLIHNGHKPRRKIITISFDDGYKNNLDVALPLLEKYKLKAAFFISSVCLGDMPLRCLWSDIVAALHYFNKDQIVKMGQLSFKNLIEVNSGVNLYDFLKTCSYPDREILLSKLIAEYDLSTKLQSVPEEWWKLLNSEELIQLAGSEYAEIGSHGHLHYNLGNTDLAFAANELKMSKRLLEETLHSEIKMIAYPDGSYTKSVKNEAEKSGYRYQLAVKYQDSHDKDDLRILDRHGVSSTTTFESNMINLSLAFKSKGH